MPEGITIALTAFAAVLTFVVGQLIQRIFIEPLQEQRRVIGRIAHALTFYRGITMDTPGDRPTDEQVADVRSALRGLAADLRATIAVLPLYRAFSCVRLVLSHSDVEQVAYAIMRWELFMSEKAKTDAVIKIGKFLKLNYIKDDWTEYLEMMDVKMQSPTDDSNDESP